MLRIEEIAEERGLEPQDVLEFLHDFVEFTEESDLAALKEALERCDHNSVRERAHSIKGAAVNLKLDQIAAIAREIEQRAKDLDAAHATALVSDLEASLAVLKDFLKNIDHV